MEGMKGEMGDEAFKQPAIPSYFTGSVENHVRW